MQAYFSMIREVLAHGTPKGRHALSTFNYNYELCWDEVMYARTLQQPQADRRYVVDHTPGVNGYALPLLDGLSWEDILIETLWTVTGRRDLDEIHRMGTKVTEAVKISDREDSDVAPAYTYANRWRRFSWYKGPARFSVADLTMNVERTFSDQIVEALEAVKKRELSNRIIVSATGPGLDPVGTAVVRHPMFVLNVQHVNDPNKASTYPVLCMHLTTASANLADDIPATIARYSLLFLFFSHLTGIKPGIFAHTMVDMHLALEEVPDLMKRMEALPKNLPRLTIAESVTLDTLGGYFDVINVDPKQALLNLFRLV